MKSTKKVLTFFTALFMVCIFCLGSTECTYADDTASSETTTYTSNNGTVFSMPAVTDNTARVYDYAGLFTDSEIASLTAQIKKTEANRDCDVIILTSKDVPEDADYGTDTSRNYAEQFYIDNGFAEDGWIFIIDMNNRVLWSAGHGRFYKEKYVDFAQKVYDDALHYASDGNYYGAAEVFVKDVYKLDNVLYALIPTPVSLVISAVLALIALVAVLAKHNTSQPVNNAKIAVRTLDYRELGHNSVFLGKNVTHHTIVRSGGGGSGGGFSGGMHSGGGFSGGGGGFSGGGGHF